MILKGGQDVPYVDRTIYQRFKVELQRDDEGNLMPMDFLTDKFQIEFDR